MAGLLQAVIGRVLGTETRKPCSSAFSFDVGVVAPEGWISYWNCKKCSLWSCAANSIAVVIGEGAQMQMLYAPIFFFSLMTFGRKTASWPDMRRASARSSFAPRASLLMLSVFSVLSMYRCCTKRLSSRRSNPSFHDLISCAFGSPAVDEAPERCEGATEGVRVGVVL